MAGRTCWRCPSWRTGPPRRTLPGTLRFFFAYSPEKNFVSKNQNRKRNKNKTSSFAFSNTKFVLKSFFQVAVRDNPQVRTYSTEHRKNSFCRTYSFLQATLPPCWEMPDWNPDLNNYSVYRWMLC